MYETGNFTLFTRRYKSWETFLNRTQLNTFEADYLLEQGFTTHETAKLLLGYYFQVSYEQGVLNFLGNKYSTLKNLLQSNSWEKGYFVAMLENTPEPILRELKNGLYLYRGQLYYSKKTLCNMLGITQPVFDSLDKAYFVQNLEHYRKQRRKEMRHKRYLINKER